MVDKIILVFHEIGVAEFNGDIQQPARKYKFLRMRKETAQNDWRATSGSFQVAMHCYCHLAEVAGSEQSVDT